VVYNIDGEFKAAFLESGGKWRGANGVELQLRNFVLFAVSVLYESKAIPVVENDSGCNLNYIHTTYYFHTILYILIQ